MRQPMEEMYGAQVFAKMWEAWVDGMSAYSHRPEGRDPSLLLAPCCFRSYEGKGGWRTTKGKTHLYMIVYCGLLLPGTRS